MTDLSIIIPFLKGTPTDLFEETLASVLEFHPDYADILVVNAADYDDCYQISEEGVGFCHADSSCGLIEAINLGVRSVESPIVHPVLCGGRVEENWATIAMRRFENPAVGAVGALVNVRTDEGEEEPDLSIGGLAYLRSGEVISLPSRSVPKNARLAPWLGGAFFRRNLLLDLGLFEESLDPAFAFVDMSLLMSALGKRTVLEKNAVLDYNPEGIPFPEWEEWLTGQESLFQRWSDMGNFSSKWLHSCRVGRESLSAFFSGKLGALRAAYKAGRNRSGIKGRKAKLGAARSAILARRKEAASATK